MDAYLGNVKVPSGLTIEIEVKGSKILVKFLMYALESFPQFLKGLLKPCLSFLDFLLSQG